MRSCRGGLFARGLADDLFIQFRKIPFRVDDFHREWRRDLQDVGTQSDELLQIVDASDVFGGESVFQATFECVDPLPVVTLGAEETTNPGVAGRGERLQESVFGTEQEHADVGRFEAAEVGVVLDDAVVAFGWFQRAQVPAV